MAVISCFSVTLVSYSGIINSHVSEDLKSFENAWWPPHESDSGVAPIGSLTTHWPVAANGRAISGFKAGSYFDDFYNRIHVIPSLLELGNIVSTQTSAVKVWNAFLTPQTLLSIAGIDDGIELSGQDEPPVSFTPLEEREWSVAITTDGPFVLDAQLTWLFASGSSAVLTVTGNRITAFPFLIDWTDGVRERLAWATDILQSETGAEQCRALRIAPRRTLGVDLFIDKRERQHFDVVLFGWSTRVWAIPVWFDVQLLNAPVAIGAFTIACNTVGRDFRAGGLAMLLGETAFQYETVEILSLTATQLTLKRATLQNWPVSTRLYPVRTAQFDGAPKLTRLHDQLQKTSIDFAVVEPCDWTAIAPAVTYRGYPVYDTPPDESDDLTSEYQQLLLTLDSGMGAAALITDTADLSRPVNLHRWKLFGRSEQTAFRSFIYYLNGRQKRVWVPTHADDLTLVAVAANTSTVIDVANIGYTRFARNKTGRCDIRIQLNNGSVFYRRITNSVEINSDVERLLIDSALGVQVNPADVMRISWLMLMRSDSDTVNIKHETDADGLATSEQVFIGVADDV